MSPLQSYSIYDFQFVLEDFADHDLVFGDYIRRAFILRDLNRERKPRSIKIMIFALNFLKNC